MSEKELNELQETMSTFLTGVAQIVDRLDRSLAQHREPAGWLERLEAIHAESERQLLAEARHLRSRLARAGEERDKLVEHMASIRELQDENKALRYHLARAKAEGPRNRIEELEETVGRLTRSLAAARGHITKLESHLALKREDN